MFPTLTKLMTLGALASLTVVPAVGAASAQLLPNGDFEQGSTIWTEFSQNGWDIILNSGFPSPVLPHSGSWLAWLGGDIDEISYIEQQVMVPALASGLSYWRWIDSEDLCGFDLATVTVNGSVADQYDLCETANTGGWAFHAVNIASYAGQTVTIRIRVDTDDTWNSNLFVDDVSFEVFDGFFADGFESGDTSAWSDSSP